MQKKTNKYEPKTTTKVGDIVGKAYDLNDSPVGEIVKSSKTKYRYTDKKTGKSVESESIRELVERDYLSVTDGRKYVYIRWARTKNFDIRLLTRPWVDKRPHWRMDYSEKIGLTGKK